MHAPQARNDLNLASQSVERALSASPSAPGFLVAFARRAVLRQLRNLRDGELVLLDGEATHRFGARSEALPRTITVCVRDPRFYADLAFGGSVGAGEAYMDGSWTTSNLTELVRLFVRNMAVLDGMESGIARLSAALRKLVHALRRNTRMGSRRNVAAHYDLGNEFFRLFLDETLMYSSAMFPRPGMTLGEAQAARLDCIARKLDLGPGDHVLEIGTGWGGFALHAAGRYGCRVTTTTISREQYTLACERVAAAGLADRIEVLCSDYRDLDGRYDKIVSIEMIEAVGHQYYDTFFAKCARLLEPHGAMLLQAITIADNRYAQARDSVDFIRRYIFPGSCIPSVGALASSIARATDMRILDLEDIGQHYATTLRMWRENLLANVDRARSLGFDDTFLRMWEYYFCYCEGGFLERVIGDAHLLLVKPRSRLVAP